MNVFRLQLVAFAFALAGCGDRGPDKKTQPPTSSCGDGLLAPTEKCDPAIGEGLQGACPTECADVSDACGSQMLVGVASDCSAECVAVEAACANGDGCCPGGCDATSDDDCTNTCGDGVIEGAEVCDGNCPASCDDSDACTVDVAAGAADTCSLRCTNQQVTACADGDGCCPSACTSDDDDDCSDSCGDGVLDPGELCDGDCPTSCDDGGACTTDRLVGSASACSAQCAFEATTQCTNGDGCCPAGCTFEVDDDCACTPRTCEDVGWECGMIDDLCGSTRTCGACGVNETCTQGTCVADTPTGALGHPCAAPTNCNTGACLDEARFAYPDGYCTKSCETSTDCGSGGHCQGSTCFETCTSDATCRTGYGCVTRGASTVKTCRPIGSGAGSVGQSCSSTNDCSGGNLGYCLPPNDGWKDGYCSKICNASNLCPSGSHCAFDDEGDGLCLLNCSSNSTCRGAGFDGYRCYDRDNDATLECAPAGTGTRAIGQSCAGTWECAGGEDAECGTENAGFPGGYCVQLCGANSTCPTGAHCGFLLASGYCIDSCTTSVECRTGYSCQQDFVSNACWPE